MRKLLIGILLFPVIANAAFLDGNKLLRYMKSSETWENAMAAGYVMAISDTYQNEVHCAAPNVTAGQTRDVVKKYLENNPEVRDVGADVLSLVALSIAFPCKQTKPRNKQS
jgi:Tfp pilus assembly protein PilF